MNTNTEVKEVLENAEETKLSVQDFINGYDFSTEFWNVEKRGKEALKELALDFLTSYDVRDEDLTQYQEDGNDFRNDQTKEGYYRCDISSEWADSQVDIYYSELYQKVRDYADHIEDRITEV